MTTVLRSALSAAVALVIGIGDLTGQGQVTPDGGALNAPVNATNQSTFFTFSGMTVGRAYTVTVSCLAPVINCTLPRGSSFTANGSSDSWPVNYAASSSTGTGRITLTLSASGGSDQGYYNVTVRPLYAVAVTPDGGTATTRYPQSSGYSETFTVTNTGYNSNTFSFTCSGAGGITCGTVPSPVTVGGNNGVTTVSMPYSTGAPGTGTLTLTASGTSASDPGSYSVPVATTGVSVTPDGQVTATHFANTSGYSESFTVWNTGSGQNTYSFTCTGSGGVVCGTPPSPVQLNGNGQTSVTMPYSVGAAGTGTLTLTATGTGASDAGSFSVPIAATLSWVTVPGGAFTKDSRFLLVATANSYDAYGLITQVTDARSKVTNYQYGGNANNALLIKVTRVHDASGTVDLVTNLAYDAQGLVHSIQDPGASFKYFNYDSHGRLKQVQNNAQVAVKAYGYTYSRTSTNGWTFQSSSPNAVVDTTFVKQSPLVIVSSTQFIDGLGRSIQSVVKDGTNYHVAATQFDLMGRPWRSWKPYTRTTAGYDASFTTTATQWYNSSLGVSNAQPFAETLYRSDALARVGRVNPEYTGTSPTIFVQTAYGVDATASQTITEVTDESGNKTRTYTDIFGNAIKSILGYGSGVATTTTFLYNVVGQRTQTTDPRGLITSYTLDTRGLLSTRVSPDAGTANFKYDHGSNLRYTQDANQAAAGQVYFTNYDFAGRPLNSGQGTATFSTLDPDAASLPALETTTGNWLVVRAYDAKPSTAAFPWSLFSTQISPLTLTNVSGRSAAIASKSNGAWQVTLFSYDADGQVATRYTYTQANGGASVLTAVNTTIGYTRDLRGALTQRALTVGSSTFYQWYDYDNRGLFWKLYASTSSTKPATPDVTDTYRPSGMPQNFQFQGGPLEPITYTIREQTAKIGDPASTTYPFSASYTYNPNGTMSVAEFYSAGSPAAQKRYKYAFPTYDALNRMKSADFSSWGGSAWTTTAAYDLAGINYDGDGNLTNLQRYRETGTLIDNLTYSYPTGSNRLSSVTDAVGATAEVWDAETGSFTYDANGSVTTASAPYAVTAVTYDPANLPLSITRSGTTSIYRYDDAGQRITKQVGSGNTEVYILEGASTPAVFTVNSGGTATSWYFNLLAGDHVEGRQPNTGSRSYYYTDHLGSTRAVVQGTTVVESYDFEPWGLLMPGRTLGSGTKEGFGGKEQDLETGLDYFGARYYLPALGRWGAVDPAGDGSPEWSPYNYVSDNPAGQIDPDGRQAIPVTAVSVFLDQHPVLAENIRTGFTQRAQGTWRTFTTLGGWANMAGGLVTQLRAVQGDPAAMLQVGRGLIAQAKATAELVQSGEAGIGQLLGGAAFDGSVALATWGAGELVSGLRGASSAGQVAADASPGTFSISDWTGYPAGLPKPIGPFRLLEGSEYADARNAANSANRALHAADPSLDGMQIHEIQPVKFGGSPTDPTNKIPLTGPQHAGVTNWWNALQRDIERLLHHE